MWFRSYLNCLVVFPTFFSLSLNFAIRSSWSEPQSAPGLVFADCIYSLAAKNIINLISVLTIWSFPYNLQKRPCWFYFTFSLVVFSRWGGAGDLIALPSTITSLPLSTASSCNIISRSALCSLSSIDINPRRLVLALMLSLLGDGTACG